LCDEPVKLVHAAHRHARAVRVQNPVRLSQRSEPEPDLALVRPREDNYAAGHPGPGDVLLIVEVADPSLRHDRRKLASYAAAGSPEAWLFNLATDQAEVHRDPAGRQYRQVQVYGRADAIRPLAFPDLALPLADVRPRPAVRGRSP
jgi:Uma2 family endonuclease